MPQSVTRIKHELRIHCVNSRTAYTVINVISTWFINYIVSMSIEVKENPLISKKSKCIKSWLRSTSISIFLFDILIHLQSSNGRIITNGEADKQAAKLSVVTG